MLSRVIWGSLCLIFAMELSLPCTLLTVMLCAVGSPRGRILGGMLWYCDWPNPSSSIAMKFLSSWAPSSLKVSVCMLKSVPRGICLSRHPAIPMLMTQFVCGFFSR